MKKQKLSLALNARHNLMSVDDVAEILGYSRNYVYREANRGRLSSVKIGHYRRFTEANVEAYVDFLFLNNRSKELEQIKRELRAQNR